ncbi:hypothetical protein B0H15DRAFT_860983 [Mycena belliarum]|uniref:Uncharacterized protein n=1 Tax=Mycena belliarum TaxID=1033014 RepID=A0AAD6TWQ8_9AGAR|nr:hypothetical protein B0H15DRAFT_860983 [Mycena belliae]
MSHFCTATIDTQATACSLPAVEGMSWCTRHNEERIKLYGSYKSWHAALDVAQPLCNMDDIAKCTSIKAIRQWNETVRARYGLVDRCIKARERFTERFFGNDMDFGHRTFWLTLVAQREELERLLVRLEGRGYDVFLESQNAEWLRDRQLEEPACVDCPEPPAACEPPCKPQDTSAQSVELASTIPTSQLDLDGELEWDYIRWTIACYMLPASSRFYEERKRVVEAYLCRVICTDPLLTLDALRFSDVRSYLLAPNHGLQTAQRLRQRLRHAPHPLYRAAVEDVLRPADEGEYGIILGTRLYKVCSAVKFPLHAWGHIFAFTICSDCVRSLCRDVDEVIDSLRYVLFTGNAPFESPASNLDLSYDGMCAMEVLSVCGLVLSFPFPVTKRVTVAKRLQPDKTAVWAEEKRVPLVCAELSRADPNAHTFLSALLRTSLTDPDLSIMVRKARGEPIVRSSAHFVGDSMRTAASLTELRKQPWEPSKICYERLLDEPPAHTPCPGAGPRINFDDMRLAVVDSATRCDESTLLSDLIDIFTRVYGARDLLELCHMIAHVYVVRGELEIAQLKQDPGYPVFLLNCEESNVAYKALWGTVSPWRDLRNRKLYSTVWMSAKDLS